MRSLMVAAVGLLLFGCSGDETSKGAPAGGAGSGGGKFDDQSQSARCLYNEKQVSGTVCHAPKSAENVCGDGYFEKEAFTGYSCEEEQAVCCKKDLPVCWLDQEPWKKLPGSISELKEPRGLIYSDKELGFQNLLTNAFKTAGLLTTGDEVASDEELIGVIAKLDEKLVRVADDVVYHDPAQPGEKVYIVSFELDEKPHWFYFSAAEGMPLVGVVGLSCDVLAAP